MDFVIILILLALTTTSTNASSINKIGVKDLLQKILNDQEYLALDPHRQLRVLIAFYNILERHYKKIMST